MLRMVIIYFILLQKIMKIPGGNLIMKHGNWPVRYLLHYGTIMNLLTVGSRGIVENIDM